MSHRAHRARVAFRTRPAPEPIESRLLLSVGGADLGQYPLRAADPSNTVLVRFEPGADASPALNALGAFVTRQFEDGPSTIVLGAGVSPEAAVAWLGARPEVIYAEPNAVVRGAAEPLTNDPKISQLWGLDNPSDIDLDAPEAWNMVEGKSPVIVAVLDSGMDLTHPDLAGKVWINPTEVPGNRRDDDRDGYVDDVYGWNFVNNSPNVQDNNGHGTHVAGIIAAIGNNGIGGIGLNGYARIMPLKFLDASGDGSTDDAVAAIYYAVGHGARVINASWGGNEFSRPLRDAIAYATSRNVVFVAAAGNESANNDIVPTYPGSERLPGELTVTAVDRSGNLASFSNYGATTVDIAAPGVGIVSTVPGGYATYSGSSMAAPYVSAVASMVVMEHPEYTSVQVANAIKASAKPLPGLFGRIVTGGIVSASRALTANPGGVAGSSDTPVSATPILPSTLAASQDDIRAGLLGSDEYAARAGGTHRGFVTALYTDLLGRSPDPSGLSGWVASLNAGASRLDVIRSIQGSREAQLMEVAVLYRRDLGRTDSLDALKSNPDIGGWVDRSGGAGNEAALEAALLSSDEYFRNHGGTFEGLVQGLYQDLLARDADPGGLATWSALFSAAPGRFDLIRQFQQSAEVKRVLVARWYQSDLGRLDTLDQLRDDPGVTWWSQSMRG